MDFASVQLYVVKSSRLKYFLDMLGDDVVFHLYSRFKNMWWRVSKRFLGTTIVQSIAEAPVY